MTTDKAKKIIDRFNKAKNDRALIEPILQEISDYVLIHKGNFTTKNITPTVDTAKVHDTTAVEAAKRLGSTIHGGLTNSSSKWFTLQLLGGTSLSQTVAVWLENAASIMLQIFNGSYSGFSSHNFEVIMSQVTLGTGILFVEYDRQYRTLRFSSVHLSKVSILEDRWGNIDTVFVEDTITLRQAVQEFGLERLHDSWQREYDKDPDKKVSFVHEIKPKDDNVAKMYSGFKFISTYVDKDNNHIIEEKGMYNMPYIVGRFDRRAGDIYGISPAWDALPTIRQLNQEKKDITRARQLKTQPPMLFSDDAVIQNVKIGPFSSIMGGIDPITGQPRLMPLNVGGDLAGSLQGVELARQDIREMFFVDQLYFKDGTPLTATEASQRQEARTQMLSPAIDRIKTEYLDRLINVCFTILLREGHFGQLPRELDINSVKVEYLSPLARLNKMQDVLAVQRALAPLAPFAPMAPEKFARILDPIDFDKLISYSLDAAGFPASLKTSEEDLNAMKAEQQKQANLAQNMQLAGFAQQLNKPIQ